MPLIIVALCALMSSLFTATASAYEADAPPGPAPVGAMNAFGTAVSDDRAVDLRHEFGLRSDLAWVRQVAAATDSRTDQLGIPLTPAESTGIATRSARLVATADAVERVKGAAPGFAGLWIDQAAGGVVHVLTTTGDDTGVAALRQAAGPGAIMEGAAVPRTVLTDAQRRVVDLALRDASFKDALISVGVDDKRNLVDVELVPGAGSGPVVAARAVAGTDRVVIGESPVQFFTESRNRPNTFPLHGGQWVESCTVGFSNVQIATNARQMITAGHCSANGNGVFLQGRAGTQPTGDLVGSQITTSFRDGTNCDCQTVGTLNGRLPTSTVLVNDTQTFKYTNTATAGSYAVGQRACFSGANYGDTHAGGIGCGTITSSSTAVRVRDGAVLVNDTVITDIPESDGGDSGAPYGNGGSFLGIHTAGGRPISNGGVIGPSQATAFSKSTNFGTLDSRLRLIY